MRRAAGALRRPAHAVDPGNDRVAQDREEGLVALVELQWVAILDDEYAGGHLADGPLRARSRHRCGRLRAGYPAFGRQHHRAREPDDLIGPLARAADGRTGDAVRGRLQPRSSVSGPGARGASMSDEVGPGRVTRPRSQHQVDVARERRKTPGSPVCEAVTWMHGQRAEDGPLGLGVVVAEQRAVGFQRDPVRDAGLRPGVLGHIALRSLNHSQEGAARSRLAGRKGPREAPRILRRQRALRARRKEGGGLAVRKKELRGRARPLPRRPCVSRRASPGPAKRALQQHTGARFRRDIRYPGGPACASAPKIGMGGSPGCSPLTLPTRASL